MIHEYAILPGVFDPTNYTSPDACDFSLRWLKNGLLRSGLVRNLHDGSWESAVKENPNSLHMRAKELLKKLIQQGRLEIAPKEREAQPLADLEWLDEALLAHARTSLSAVLAVKAIKSLNPYKDNPLIEAVESLDSSPKWCGNCGTETITRDAATYLGHLTALVRTSRSIMLIDPHLDPSENRYQVVRELLRKCDGRTVKPLIEIHRVCYKGTGASRQFPDWESIFRAELGSVAAYTDSLKVFIWDDFHDRALISNLVGILMPNGFDVDQGNVGSTTWARMERHSVEQIQREFDPASGKHQLNKEFVLY